jgi:hypothetical protein
LDQLVAQLLEHLAGKPLQNSAGGCSCLVVLTALVVIGHVTSPSPLIQTCGVSDSTSS